MSHRLLLLLVLVVLFPACQKYESTKRLDSFELTIGAYYADLRWSRFQQAADTHLTKDGQTVSIDRGELEPIRVTGHRMIEKILSPDLDKATLVLEMGYYHNDYGNLKKIELVHNWWYNEDAKRWYLESEFPEFK